MGGMVADGVGTSGKQILPSIGRLREDFDKDQDLINRIYRATEMPPPRFADRLLFGFDPYPTIDDMRRVGWLLDRYGHWLLEPGNNRYDAWEAILAQYRLARQMAGGSLATQSALIIESQATMLALDWAASEKPTPDRLRKALADLRALPHFPTLGEIMKAEAPIVERKLDLSGAELEAAINGPRRRSVPMSAILETMLLYPSWERERARRVCRAKFKRLIAESADESKPLPNLSHYQWTEEIRRTSPLAAKVMSSWSWWLSETLNRAEAGRRGLVQVIALRAWSRDHNGTYPETLDALVPDLLDHLPLDPYSARPFGYMRSKRAATRQARPSKSSRGPKRRPRDQAGTVAALQRRAGWSCRVRDRGGRVRYPESSRRLGIPLALIRESGSARPSTLGRAEPDLELFGRTEPGVSPSPFRHAAGPAEALLAFSPDRAGDA